MSVSNANPVANKQDRFTKGTFWTAFAILIILLILSTALLSVRLYDFVTLDKRSLSIKTNTDTGFDLFSINYKNALGEITVEGADGDKVIAPGTDVEYTIRIRNADKVTLNYTLEPVADFHSEYEIPVEARILAPDDTYIAGDAKTWVTISEINSTSDEHTLAPGETAEYYFQWRWPFESGDDAYDTFLGNETLTQDISIEISSAIYAEANTEISVNPGFFPAPGSATWLWLIFFILILVAIILLLLYKLSKIAFVDVMKLDASFALGETVTLDALKQKALAGEKTEKLRITAKKEAVVSHALTVETNSISKSANAAILAAGGHVIIKNETAK